MPTLVLKFPGGRYHATPSGHHVNEGLIEWPPSPWRLLRALIACGYATQGWIEGKLPSEARRLIEALAGVLPRYRLPAASAAHSRHFMPLGVLEKNREKTTLVFDTWANVGAGVLSVRWNCEVDGAANNLFAALAENLGYLGRSESWVQACAVADQSELPPGGDAFPHIETETQLAGPGWEQVSVLAAELPGTYSRWREKVVAEALMDLPLPGGARRPVAALLRRRATAEAPYPTDLLECMQWDTGRWKAHRWSQPPGARRVLYWRPTASFEVAPPTRPRPALPSRPTAMVLALSTPSRSRSALPTVARTLPQADLLHRALAARVGADACPELTGKGADGLPLIGHRHSHLLPVDLDDDGHLDHIIVYAPMGLGEVGQTAVRALKRTWTKGGVGSLTLALAGRGSLDDLRGLPSPLAQGIQRLLGAEDGAREWKSLTPFVPPRHVKKHGKNTLLGQITAELASRGFEGAEIEVLRWDDDPRVLPLRHLVRRRRPPARPPPADVGFPVRLVFPKPVRGPIALGYGAHFGLGLFRAAD